MSNFLYKIRLKIQDFMRGRYGVDPLNKYLLYTVLGLDVVNLFIRNSIIMIICNVLLILLLFRTLSKNYVNRSLENEKFLDMTLNVRRHFKAVVSTFKDRSNRYYVCPKCHQIVRVPKGHGKIVVTCPKCRSEFTRRS